VQAPFGVAGVEATVGASVGVVVVWPGDKLPGEIMHHADVAMYTARNHGKGRFEIMSHA
jgi:predicted signal transduction protein with EAL and GGDEF domain